MISFNVIYFVFTFNCCLQWCLSCLA